MFYPYEGYRSVTPLDAARVCKKKNRAPAAFRGGSGGPPGALQGAAPLSASGAGPHHGLRLTSRTPISSPGTYGVDAAWLLLVPRSTDPSASSKIQKFKTSIIVPLPPPVRTAVFGGATPGHKNEQTSSSRGANESIIIRLFSALEAVVRVRGSKQ